MYVSMSSRDECGDGDWEGMGVLSGVVLEEDIVEATDGSERAGLLLTFVFELFCAWLWEVSRCLCFLSYGLLR